ncbi:mitotic spindle assembly checkpoint protein MAD1 [Tiliqua scincoides]|uniref:mitotic spindle assembly checkpoint protein MAD1 n=1 Tax=Tiliqua scincoides TaxID=71010 RepID=UPI00346313F7
MAGWGGSELQKEDFDGNTTVFNILKSFNTFMSQSAEEPSSLATTQSPPGSLQAQYLQMMKLEDQAGDIHSGARLLQVEREKMQMELSHKRARIEFEKEAKTNAQNYEREADRNQELQKRIKQYQERLTEAENKLQQQLEVTKTCQKNAESLSKKLQEKETKLAEAHETIGALKGEMSELQWNLMNREMQAKNHELEKKELTEQLDVLHKKRQETSQQIQALQAREGLLAEKDQRIQELEQKLSLQEQDAIIVKNMKTELAQFPKMERELQQLREENAYLREMKENNGLLKEEVEGLHRKLERSEKVQAEQVALELENEKLQRKLDTWEKLHSSTGLEIKSPDDLSRHVVALQQRELVLKEQNSAISSSARLLEKARKQLQEELLKVQSQLLEERKKREHHETMVRSLQKRVQLLIKARDGMRGILESYDNELNPSEHSPQLSNRVREAEEMVQKVEAHCAEMEKPDVAAVELGQASASNTSPQISLCKIASPMQLPASPGMHRVNWSREFMFTSFYLSNL